MTDKSVEIFDKGIYNFVKDEIVPESASVDSLGWLSTDDTIELVRGSLLLAGDGGVSDIVQNIQDETTSVGQNDAVSGKVKLAQSFKPQYSRFLGLSFFKKPDTGIFAGTVTFSIIEDVVDSPTGATLVTKTLTNEEWLTIANGFFDIEFDSSYDLTVGTRYWIIVETSTQDSTKCINLAYNTAGGYTDGKLMYNNTPNGWLDYGSSDLYFRTLTTPYGTSKGIHVGKMANGTAVIFRKAGKSIQVLQNTTWINPTTSQSVAKAFWVDTIMGLEPEEIYAFTNYTSLAGNFVYVGGIGGLYKIVLANPTNSIDMFVEANNFKGKVRIDRGRMFLWGREKDKTGLYGSKIDPQSGAVYTTVEGESIFTGDDVTTQITGNLSVVGDRKTIFGVTIYRPTNVSQSIVFDVSGITKQSNAFIEMSTDPNQKFSVGDFILVSGVSGMTEINGQIGQIVYIANSVGFRGISVTIDSSAFSTYTSGGEVTKVDVITDDFSGALVLDSVNVGSINYVTGEYEINLDYPISTGKSLVADYQWEDSSVGGIADFRKSATRVAGEGFIFRQDEGGDAIHQVLIQDGKYYSMKEKSVYQVEIAGDDASATNLPYRLNVGIPAYGGAVETSIGIVFLNNANPDKPQLTVLQKSTTGSELEPITLAPQFNLSNYTWNEIAMETYGEYVVFSGKTLGSTSNNRLFLFNQRRNVIDVSNQNVNNFAKDVGILYGGSSANFSIYQILTGYDNDGTAQENYWIGRGELFETQALKKVKRFILKGQISRDVKIKVYISEDGDAFRQIGTIIGNESYVDFNNSTTIGSSGIGTSTVGGQYGTTAFNYQTQFKFYNQTKFRKIQVKFVAEGIGYASIERITYKDIRFFDDKLPKRYRQKQNVGIDGLSTDQ